MSGLVLLTFCQLIVKQYDSLNFYFTLQRNYSTKFLIITRRYNLSPAANYCEDFCGCFFNCNDTRNVPGTMCEISPLEFVKLLMILLRSFRKCMGKVVRVLDMLFEWFKRLKNYCDIFQIAG